MNEAEYKAEIKKLATEYGIDHLSFSFNPQKHMSFEEKLKEVADFLKSDIKESGEIIYVFSV